MTQTGSTAAPAFGRREAKADIIDADYITLGVGASAGMGAGATRDDEPVREAPVRDTSKPNLRAFSKSPAVEMDGMGMLRASEAPTKPDRNDPGSPIFWAVGSVIVVAAFWMSGGHQVVRAMFPATDAMTTSAVRSANPSANAVTKDLRITSFNSYVDPMGVRPQLVVSGQAVNDGKEVTNLPSILIEVTSGNGMVTRYTLGTGGSALLPGDSFPFSGRLDAPKGGVKSVSFDFK